jgi:hypothetical protein
LHHGADLQPALVVDKLKKMRYNQPIFEIKTMPNDEPIDEFLMISREMFRGFFPQEKAEAVCSMKRSEHAFLTHRETTRVDEALGSMALAKDEQAVRAIFNALSEDTVTALCSRWMNFYKLWISAPPGESPRVWPYTDSWRSIFLAQIFEPEIQRDALKRLCPEALEADLE